MNKCITRNLYFSDRDYEIRETRVAGWGTDHWREFKYTFKKWLHCSARTVIKIKGPNGGYYTKPGEVTCQVAKRCFPIAARKCKNENEEDPDKAGRKPLTTCHNLPQAGIVAGEIETKKRDEGKIPQAIADSAAMWCSQL